MGDLLVRNIGQLVTNDPAHGGELGLIPSGAVLIEGGVVTWAGHDVDLPAAAIDIDEVDAGGSCAIPGFVDSHTHVVFAGDRAEEFAMRLRGASYEQIMATGGGILSTVRATRAAGSDELFSASAARTGAMLEFGTTTIEIKSGYGLDIATEQRLLRVAGRIDSETPIEVITTFLGGHAIPPEFSDNRSGYVRHLIEEMLPVCSPLATQCDVFCDRGAFDLEESRAILEAARGYGLGLRMHADQLAATGAATLAAELGAASADHLDYVSAESLQAMRRAGTVAVLLPGVSFSMRIPYPDVGPFREAGVPIAIATDANPGTSYVLSMQLIVALASLEMGMSPEEALWGATRGGAVALGLERHGSLMQGAPGDVVLLDADSYTHLVYRPGENLATKVIKRGAPVV